MNRYYFAEKRTLLYGLIIVRSRFTSQIWSVRLKISFYNVRNVKIFVFVRVGFVMLHFVDVTLEVIWTLNINSVG